jgi:GDSL-like lipase/acylhydrolase family protein
VRSQSTILQSLMCAATAMTLATAAAKAPKFNPPKTYYLALGDSVPFGLQWSKYVPGGPAIAFSTGYVDDFAEALRRIQPGITIVNYSCPGETTLSFIAGGCPWLLAGEQLHDRFIGIQLDAAVAFLLAHPGDVSPITVTLWGNDVSALVHTCGQENLACIEERAPAAIRQVAANLTYALLRLRDAAPDAEIIVTGVWDSFIGAFDVADPLFAVLNSAIADSAATAQARFADPFPVFNPQGDFAIEAQAICTFTLLCGVPADSHPSDLGYQRLADVVFVASGYSRVLE